MNTEETPATTHAEDKAPEAPKRKRGRPRKNPLPESALTPVQETFAVPEPEPAPEPAAAPPAEPVAPPVRESIADPFPAPEPAPAAPEVPAAVFPPLVPAARETGPEPGLPPDDDMQARREAAMRMKRGIDDMSDSIAAMQAFFAKKTSTQTAMAQQAKSLANKAAKQAARERAAKEAAVKAAAARLTESARAKQPPPAFPGKVRLDRWGRPLPAAAQPAQQQVPPPQKRNDQTAARPPAPPPNPDMPVLNMAELQRCGADDLAALAEEVRLDENGGAAFQSRHELVLALLAEHARRGGVVDCEGVYLPAKDQAGVLVSPLNGLRRTPSDVRVTAQFAAAAGLRPGDSVVCRAVPGGPGGRAPAPFEASDAVSVNGLAPEKARRKLPFDAFAPRVPSVRIRLGGAPGSWTAGADASSPLAEGGRGLVEFCDCDGTAAELVLAGIAEGIKASNAGVDAVLALFDPDPAATAALAARAAADRDAGRAPAFELVAHDPGDHPDKSSTFAGTLCEFVRRRAANGRRVVLVTDAPGPFATGFARGLPGTCPLAPEAALEREAGEFRRLWRSVRDLDGAGSLTVIASVRPADACGEALAAALRSGADWTAKLTCAPGGTPEAQRTFSRHSASSLRDGAPAAQAAEPPPPVFRAPVDPA